METFDPEIYGKNDYMNRWSFVSFSVMNLDYDEVKICFTYPPNIMSCDMKYKGIHFNQDYPFKMIVGEKFNGIIRTLKVLNWPKLEIHYKGVYLEGEECQKFPG